MAGLCRCQSPKNAQGWHPAALVSSQTATASPGGLCQPGAKLTSNCTSFHTNLPADGSQGDLQGNQWVAPAAGPSQSSTWSHACLCRDADSRACGSKAEMRAAGMMAHHVPSSPPHSATMYHRLEHSWPPQSCLVCMNGGGHVPNSWRSPIPPGGYGGALLGVGAQAFSTSSMGGWVWAGDHWWDVSWHHGASLMGGLSDTQLRALHRVLWKGWEEGKLLPNCREWVEEALWCVCEGQSLSSSVSPARQQPRLLTAFSPHLHMSAIRIGPPCYLRTFFSK